MFPRIKSAIYLEDYKLELTFSDGVKAIMDFRKKIVGRGGVFSSLEDLDYFRLVQVDNDAGSVVWPNGVDFCPDVVYSEATGTKLPSFDSLAQAKM